MSLANSESTLLRWITRVICTVSFVIFAAFKTTNMGARMCIESKSWSSSTFGSRHLDCDEKKICVLRNCFRTIHISVIRIQRGRKVAASTWQVFENRDYLTHNRAVSRYTSSTNECEQFTANVIFPSRKNLLLCVPVERFSKVPTSVRAAARTSIAQNQFVQWRHYQKCDIQATDVLLITPCVKVWK